MKTTHLNPSKAPFTNTISFQRAVEWNLEEQSQGVPHRSMEAMFASLLEELSNNRFLDEAELSRILNLEITHITKD